METRNQRDDQRWAQRHAAMVKLLIDYGIKDQAVLAAMRKVPRHLYVPKPFRFVADVYGDYPVSIGFGQTISQPYIVAYMTERLGIMQGDKVLEIGTGSGYQAAILAELGAIVYTIEIVPALAEHARSILAEHGHESVRVIIGNGYDGYPDESPYDAIICTCAPPKTPDTLVNQLAEGGRMILPVGVDCQRLVLVSKREGKAVSEDDMLVRFVPMVAGGQK